MRPSTVIDCDGHVAEPWEMYQLYADPEFRDRIPRRVDVEGHRWVIIDGEAYPGYSEVSERTRQRIDDEMRRIVGQAHDEAVQVLSENRDRLESLAAALFEAETLEGPEAYAAAGLDRPSAAAPAEPATLVTSR